MITFRTHMASRLSTGVACSYFSECRSQSVYSITALSSFVKVGDTARNLTSLNDTYHLNVLAKLDDNSLALTATYMIGQLRRSIDWGIKQ